MRQIHLKLISNNKKYYLLITKMKQKNLMKNYYKKIKNLKDKKMKFCRL